MTAGTPFRRVWRVLGLGAAVLLVLGAVLAWQARGVRQDLDAARADLEQARAAVQARDFPRARASLEAAARRSRSAAGTSSGALWRAAAAVPVLGDSPQAVSGLAGAARTLTEDVLPPTFEAAEGVDLDQVRGPDGRFQASTLVEVQPAVTSALSAVERVAADVARLPGRGLLPPVAAARDELRDQLDVLVASLRTADDGLRLAPALLGVDRPRRYLVLVQQTAESRGTGGLVGGYAEVLADDGRVRVVRSGSNQDLRNGRVAPPPEVPEEWLQRYEPRGALDLWFNVNISPDLPTVARVVEGRWRAQGGAPLDAVVVLDARALRSILRGSPPLALPDGTSLAVDDLEQYLAVEQYRGAAAVEAGAQLARKERLADIADLALARITSGEGTGGLLQGLSEAVRSGHLHLASDDEVLQPVLAAAGVDGALPAGDAPVAYPVVHNVVGGKLDHWLDRSVAYEAGPCGTQRRSSRITTTLRSSPPPGLPDRNTLRFVDGPGSSPRQLSGAVSQSTTNRVSLSVYATRGAALVRATLDGEPVSAVLNRTPTLLERGTEAGLPVWSVVLDLPPGQDRTFVLELVEPTAPGAARVPEQPLSRDLVRDVDVPEC